MRKGILVRSLAATLLSAALALAAAPVAALAAGGETKQEIAVVDVNNATVEELMGVRGLGPVIAQRIVEFREKNGPFKTVDDLLKVQGIGEKSLAKVRDLLSVGKAKK